MTAASKSLIVVALAIASVPLNATEIDDLVDTSQSIRDTFAYGIKTIAGGESYAGEGYIAPAMAENGYISKEQARRLQRKLLPQFKRLLIPTIPMRTNTFKTKPIKQWKTVSEMIDAYVEAAQQIIMVATVNEMAQDAQSAADEREAMALQEFMGANDVTLQDERD